MDVAYCNDHCVFLVLKGVRQEVDGTCKNFNIFIIIALQYSHR